MARYLVRIEKPNGRIVRRSVDADTPQEAEDLAAGDDDVVLGVTKAENKEKDGKGGDKSGKTGGGDSSAEGGEENGGETGEENGDGVEILSVEEIKDGEDGTSEESNGNNEEEESEEDDGDKVKPGEEHPWFKPRGRKKE